MALGRLIGGGFVALFLAAQAMAVELVMVQQPGCEWCERWHTEIGPSYSNTSEGRFAPLRQVDLRALREDLAVARRVAYTPTFLIVENNRELARLEGYPGADFFWPLLTALVAEHAGFDPAAPADADGTQPIRAEIIEAGATGKT
ncbi:thioredoxin domain-containing protein [Jhaorihella thermophila]|uniref:Regulatory protein SoxS n=1 Tax=Jhaorihella thermophila TaxID=488547 RepID=A0A1H5X1I1_9RHOB|nr:hypothetical protein [Jhaorihella thermophila]SEG05631.1 hypothetical protein SAMN05421751_109140 [Jhaorihella thermophila]